MGLLRLEVVAAYPNKHFLDPVILLPSGRFDRRYWFLRGLPSFRSGLGWSVPQPSCILNGPGRVGNFAAAVAALRRAEASLFYGLVMGGLPQLLLAAASIRFGIPTYIMSEGLRNSPPQGLRQRLVALACNRPNVCLLACGDGAAEDYLGLGMTRWTYRRYAFAETYPPAAPHVPSNDGLHILLSGRLIPRKNFLSVLARLREISPAQKVIVDVAGEGPERAALAEAARALPSTVELRLHGLCDRKQLDALFRQADIFILPSLYDGWGVVVNEAVAHGVPVLVSDRVRSGQNFLVQPGVNGFVYHTDDDYRAHLRQMLEDPALRARLRQGAREIATKWDARRLAARLAEVLSGGEPVPENGALDVMIPAGTAWWAHATNTILPADPDST